MSHIVLKSFLYHTDIHCHLKYQLNYSLVGMSWRMLMNSFGKSYNPVLAMNSIYAKLEIKYYSPLHFASNPLPFKRILSMCVLVNGGYRKRLLVHYILFLESINFSTWWIWGIALILNPVDVIVSFPPLYPFPFVWGYCSLMLHRRQLFRSSAVDGCCIISFHYIINLRISSIR